MKAEEIGMILRNNKKIKIKGHGFGEGKRKHQIKKEPA